MPLSSIVFDSLVSGVLLALLAIWLWETRKKPIHTIETKKEPETKHELSARQFLTSAKIMCKVHKFKCGDCPRADWCDMVTITPPEEWNIGAILSLSERKEEIE